MNTVVFREGRALDPASLTPGLVSAIGSASGSHDGSLAVARDGRTLVFRPAAPFALGETVEVTLRSGLRAADGSALPPLDYSFEVGRTYPRDQMALLAKLGEYGSNPVAATPQPLSTDAVCTDLPSGFPPFNIRVSTNPDPGYLFMSPYSGFASGNITIIDNVGQPLFFRHFTNTVHDFAVQPNGLLTYFETAPADGMPKYFALDQNYALVDSFTTGNGYVPDTHELQLLPNGHFLIMAYDPEPVRMDLIVTGGSPDAIVTGLIVQEIDADRNVVFQWRSWDHFQITDCNSSLVNLKSTSIDYVHGNAVDLMPDGNLLLSSRHMSEITKIDRQTGDIIWRMGGHAKNNQFTFVGDTRGFSHQHDVRWLPNGHMTLFDNGNSLSPAYSRMVEYEVDEANKVATQVMEFYHNPRITTSAMGSTRRLPSGKTLIGWGGAFSLAKFTEFNPDGSVSLELGAASNITSYRTVRASWRGTLLGADAALDFGTAYIGHTVARQLRVTNGSAADITIGCAIAPDPQFAVTTPLPLTLPAGGEAMLDVAFTPSAAGNRSGKFYLRVPGTTQFVAQDVTLTGVGQTPAIIGAQSTSTVICPANSCVTLPVNIQRFDPTPTRMLGASVTFQLSANLSLCAGTSSISEGTYLSSAGGTTFQVIDNGGGSYTVDGATLGSACGPTALTGNLFNVAVTSSAAGGTGSITVTAILMRDCNNDALLANPGSPGTVPIDTEAPVVMVSSPNGGETWIVGSSHAITWTATDNVAVSSVDLDWSTDGGATYPNVIASGLPNTGSYAWTVPNTLTAQGRVRVTAHDTGCASGLDASDADFRITPPPLTIVATSGAGGSISPAGAVVVPYGTDQTFTITPDGCHSLADVAVDGVPAGALSSYTFTNVTADHTIAATFSFNVAAVAAPTDLAAAQVKTGNDADGTTKTTITYSAPAAASVEVWRAGFGGYPLYDHAGGSVPTLPGAYPPAGWTLTGVTASSQADEATARDYWYFVAYAKDACGNVSPVSNMTAGTLGYHLGDVTDGLTPGQGDNKVTLADISLLGAHYGLSGAGLAGYEYLDVGPTTTTTANGRPTVDAKTGFEDLMIFALNFTPRVSLVLKGGGSAIEAAGADLVSVGQPDAVIGGEIIDVPVQLSGAGDLQAVSLALRWDARVVEPVGISAGDLVTSQGGVVLSPKAGAVDAALLGVGSRGISGQGLLATVRFRAVTAGVPAIGIERVVGRDPSNADVAVQIGAGVEMARVATTTELQPVIPNPSRANAVLTFSLAAAGHVDLSIYSVDGRRVRTIVDGVQASGTYRFAWNGTDERGSLLESGVYYVRFAAAGVHKTRLITLLK